MHDPKIQQLIEDLEARTRKIGLYVQHVAVATNDEDAGEKMARNLEGLQQFIDNGSEVSLLGIFLIGDVAWRTRTQDPEQHEFDKIAQSLIPDPVDELREKMRKVMEEGQDPTSIFDIENDLEGEDG